MIPFGIFLGICSGGLVFMVYFLVGFWRDSRRRQPIRQCPAIRIPAEPAITIRKAQRVLDFSRTSTDTEFEIGEPERELRPARRAFVNPRRMKVAK